MAGPLKTLTGKSKVKLSGKRFAIIVAEWNYEITEALFHGAKQALVASGVGEKNITRINVPGSFELPLGAMKMARKKDIDAVICLGCVIQGDTPHFDYICQAVSYGIMRVGLDTEKPVAFGVLTTLNQKQAEERAGGKLGNKGEEAALTAINMLAV